MLLYELYTLMANWMLFLMSLLAFLVFGKQLLACEKEFRRFGDPTVVDLEMAYKQEAFSAILKIWIGGKGDGAIPALRRQLWYDNFWAVTYAVLFSSLIAIVTTQQGEEPDRFVLLLFALPLFAALFDILPENSLYLWLLRNVRNSDQADGVHGAPVFVASIAARIKFSLLIIALVGFASFLLVKLAYSLPSLQSIYSSMSNWLLILISLLTSLLYILVLFPAASRQYRAESDPQITKLQLAFSKERFTAVLRSWHQSRGSAAIPSFRKSIIRLDFIFPIVYAVFFSSVIASLTTALSPEPDQTAYILFTLPLLAGFFDWIENLLHLRILKGVDTSAEIEAVSPAPIMAASIAALFKWILVLASCIAIMVLLVMWLI